MSAHTITPWTDAHETAMVVLVRDRNGQPLEAQPCVLASAVRELERRLIIAERGLEAVRELIDNSYAIYGLRGKYYDVITPRGKYHDVITPWHALRTGGRHRRWLIDFDRAIEQMENTP